MTFDSELRFEFMLARDLGMTVAALRRRVSQQEFTQWAQFYAWEQRKREEAQRRAMIKRHR